MRRLAGLLLLIVLVVTGSIPALAAFTDTPHPYMLWTKDEAAAIRKQIDTEPWAKTQFARLDAMPNQSKVYANLFKYAVMGDLAAAKTEKDYLMTFAGTNPANYEGKLDQDARHLDNYLSALRYDTLYELLTPDERKRVEDTFRVYISYQLNDDKRIYGKYDWLPNMQWPRPMAAYLMAIALKDQDLITKSFNDRCGWKWYLDEYISDGYFYNEEFGKQYSMIGAMLLYCRGMERLGLDDMGYGYTGKGGATMRHYLESLNMLGYPQLDMGTTRPAYPRMAMGDAKGGGGAKGDGGLSGFFIQHNNITGYYTNGNGGNGLFTWANMNGRDHSNRVVERMAIPLWFEIAAKKWPDGGFDYFLAQMRSPAEDKYYPTLYFGLEPIDPATVKAPAAPSWVSPTRGVAMLRADESANYWSGPAPAVGVRFATPYVHSVNDAFALAGFYAFNRPLYTNRQHSPNYANTDPGWSASARSHSTVMVDGQEPKTVAAVPVRSDFQAPVKFVAARAKGVYDDVDQTRALFLTKDYLLDFFRLESPYARSYQWAVQPMGHAYPDNPNDFAATTNLIGTYFDLANEKSNATGKDWGITTVQSSLGADPATAPYGKSFFENRIGVRVNMLGESGTIVTTAMSPVTGATRDRFNYGADEPGGITVLAQRSAAKTTFSALHEPFKTTGKVSTFTKLGETADALLVKVTGIDINDRAMVRFGDNAATETTVYSAGESYTFTDHAYLRISADKVEATGKITGMYLRVQGTPKLFINGIEQKATYDGDMLIYGMRLPSMFATPIVVPPLRVGPLSTRWAQDNQRLATGGTGTATLKLRNNGLTALTQTIQLTASEGLALNPAQVKVTDMAPGGEQDVTITVTADAKKTGSNMWISMAGVDPAITVENARLRVTEGMVNETEQTWPRDFAAVIYGPRYQVKFYYLTNVAAALLLDPAGNRRSGGGSTLPVVSTFDAAGKKTAVQLPGFLSFDPQRRKDAGQLPYILERGQHPHGYRSPFEFHFTEDWMWVKYKDAPGRVVLDWSYNPGNGVTAGMQYPPLTQAYANDQVVEAKSLANAAPIRALFQRPAGMKYGTATFYPEDSHYSGGQDGYVDQPGTLPMAVTFCTAEEFAAMADKWIKNQGNSDGGKNPQYGL